MLHFLQKVFLALGMFTCVEEGGGGASAVGRGIACEVKP